MFDFTQKEGDIRSEDQWGIDPLNESQLAAWIHRCKI